MDVTHSWRAPGRRPPSHGKPPLGGQVALLLLTTPDELLAAYGQARDFWKRLRDRYGELTYFCWLELTRAGRPHYHAILVNPPRGFWSRETKAWLEEAWGLGFVKRKRRDGQWFSRQAGAYVGQYAKKFGHKDYQQDYDAVPRELRTFMANRTEHPLEELKQHESRWVATFITDEVDPETRMHVEPYVRLDGLDRHVCAPGGLRFVQKLFRNAGARQKRRAAPFLSPRTFPPVSEISQTGLHNNEGGGLDEIGLQPGGSTEREHGTKKTPGAERLTARAPGVPPGGPLCDPTS